MVALVPRHLVALIPTGIVVALYSVEARLAGLFVTTHRTILWGDVGSAGPCVLLYKDKCTCHDGLLSMFAGLLSKKYYVRKFWEASGGAWLRSGIVCVCMFP